MVVEWFEVFIHSVLYIRRLYPEPTFRKRRIYNVPVFVCIFPPVIEYIRSVLKSARYLLRQEKLFRLEVVIYKDTNDAGELREVTKESYCCEVLKLTKENRDSYLFDFEDNVKKSLLLLEERVKILPRLSSSCRFKLLLQTSRSAYAGLMDQNDLCNFLWYREDTEDVVEATDETKIQILPVTNVDKIGIQVHVETHELIF